MALPRRSFADMKKFLLRHILLLLSYVLSTSALPFINPIGSCASPSGPILEDEAIDPDFPGLFELPTWDAATSEKEVELGETAGFNPNPPLDMEYPTVERWSAHKAERLSILYPNKTGLYFRDQVLKPFVYPWSTIGRVDFRRHERDKGGWCTGSMVGRNLLLTASHCFPWGYGRGKSMRFTPGYNNGTEPYGGSYVSRCRGVKNTFNVTGIDYVVCQLCEPLGDITGWMKTSWWKDGLLYTLRRWRTSGYPIDAFNGQAQMFLDNRTLNKIDHHGELGVELESDVFATAGWSGGPMWESIDGEPTIVGVCSGGENDCNERPGGCFGTAYQGAYHDVSAGGRLMTDLVRYGISHWQPET